MKRVSDILKNCEIQKVLCYLTEGLPKSKCENMLERYYSLYRQLSGLWTRDKSNAVIITGFRQMGKETDLSAYSFFCVHSSSDMHSFVEEEQPVNWKDILKKKTECLIPECFLHTASVDLLTTEILLQIEKEALSGIRKRRSSKLFKNVMENAQSGKRKLNAVEKTLETALNYQMDRRLIQNAVLEYNENNLRLIKWGEILEERESPFVKELISDLMGKEMLVRQVLARPLVSEIDTPVYKWFIKMDPVNIPDICRCYSRLNILRSYFKQIQFSDYEYVKEEHLRIIIEHNPSNSRVPIVYIRNKYGEKIDFSESEFGLSRVLCMDIFMTDEKIGDNSQVLATLAFYMEYPIRVRRIQREYMLFALIGMLYLCDCNHANAEREEGETNGCITCI